MPKKKVNEIYDIEPITLSQMNAPQEIDKTPKKFYGYIDKSGYIAIKHYNEKRYKEVQDDDMPLFISEFTATDSDAAMKYVKNILERTFTCPYNK